MNKDEFDTAVEAARARLRADGSMGPPAPDYDLMPRAHATGCLPIIAMLVLAVLVVGCQQACDCGWLTGPPYCEPDMSEAYTWAYLPDWGSVTDWTVNILNEVVTCYDENGEPISRQVCGVDNITAVLKDDWVFVNVDLALCSPPAPTATVTP